MRLGYRTIQFSDRTRIELTLRTTSDILAWHVGNIFGENDSETPEA
jgi:hypothetical protein